MQELLEHIAQILERLNELEQNFSKLKENSMTITKVVEVVKEVPVEVIKEVEKVVQPDTTELEAKVALLNSRLGAINEAVVGLTSVAPVVDKVADVVGQAVVDAVEAPAPTPAADAFVATEPAVTELTTEEIKAAPVAEPTA